MSEMVERVTEALRNELQKIGYGVGTINAGQLSDALARAAIAAMREPTEEMWKKKDQPAWSLGRPMWDWWRSMIDTALE